MNNWKINKTVDLARGIDGVEVWPHALLVTGDKNAHEWNVTVMDNGKPASLDGIIQAYFVRSDGATVTATGSVAGNVATVTLPEACYAYEGDLQAVMQLIESDVSVTISALLLRVRQISTDVIIDPGEEIPSLDDLLAQIEKLKQATKDANAATTNANQAATNAETRVDEAISEAEGRVNTAVQSAETATSKANASATKADTATANANTAIDRANAAAKAAEEIVVEKNIATKDYVSKQIDAIEVGGRNYLTETSEEWKQFTGFWNYQVSDIFPVGENEDIKPGDKFTIQGEIDNKSDNNTEGGLWVEFPNAHDPNIYLAVDAKKKEKIVHTFTIPEDANSLVVRVYFGQNAEGNLWYRKLKLERGNKATDWTPAPEDVNAKIDAIEIGGTNLLPSGTAFDNFAGWSKNAEFDLFEVVEKDGFKCLHAGGSVRQMISVPVEFDATYMYSCRIMFNQDVNIENSYPLHEWCGPTEDGTFGEDISGGMKLWTRMSDAQIKANTWADIVVRIITKPRDEFGPNQYLIMMPYLFGGCLNNPGIEFWMQWIKLEKGNKNTAGYPSMADMSRAISRRSVVTYDYDGRDLKRIFGTPDKLHAALAAEDYTNIATSDYWPITLNGTFWDYGSYTVPSGTRVYSDPDLRSDYGTAAITREASYYSETAVKYTTSEWGDIYVNVSDCLPYFERTCNNVTVKLEVAGINHYWRYGDSDDLADGKPHLTMISRDCLPFSMAMRKSEYKWGDETATNPWVGSALYKTLNDPDHGIIHLLMQTELWPYIYSGPNGKGMSAMMETKGPIDTNATGWKWYDRGKLFLPSITEVFGCPYFAEPNLEGLANQLSIFRDSRRHISKGYGDSGSKTYWWLSSSSTNTNNCFVHITYAGNFSSYITTSKYSVPICFIFA